MIGAGRTFARIGAVMYAVWGLLHIKAAYEVYALSRTVPAGMIEGRLGQSAWNLAFFAVLAVVVAATLNWRNNLAGYRINLTATSVTDIGFILFVLMPGYMPLFPGIVGPVFWLLGAFFTSLGIRRPDPGQR